VTPVRVAMTVAGSDSSGGAGVVADAVTFTTCGVWATVAVTAVTAQNTVGVTATTVLDPAMVRAQMSAVASDVGVDGWKTGMLAGAATVEAVVAAMGELGLPAPVVDPVCVASSGQRLLDDEGLAALRSQLVPRAAVVTPNLAEAAALTGLSVAGRAGMEAAARALVAMGAQAALVTGGHLPGSEVADCLLVGAGRPHWLSGPRIGTSATHGTGCVLSAAIAAALAQGVDIADACAQGVSFVRAALSHGVRLGHGPGPVDPALGRVSRLAGPP
jgi:hydroxymethylpyrimidine kinase/phosphomethylpyrimidine kinase